MLPLISPDLKLTDSQGALLTVGYTVSLPVHSAMPLALVANTSRTSALHQHPFTPSFALAAIIWQILILAKLPLHPDHL